jgi:dimethylaniline monooxygenase (N-oxide forming)
VAEGSSGSCLCSCLCEETQSGAFVPAEHDSSVDGPAHRRPTGLDTLPWRAADKAWTQDFDFVAVCTGQFSDKNIISHPGQDAFVQAGGQVMHSSDYTDSSLATGKNVVVLGGSKSATDIAVNAAKNGAKSVTLVYREPVWRVPYFIGGINFKRLLYMRAQELQFNGWSPSITGKILSTLFKPLIWANFRGLEIMLKTQLKLKKWDMVPDVPIEKDASCSLPIVTPGLFEGFEAGTIKPVRGTIDHYENGHAVLTTGDRVPCDVSVLAVGWKLGVPYLAKEYQDKLIEPDGQYRVYRLSVNPDLPDMGFVGFNSSFCTILSAEMIANWLVRFADGQLANQPTDQGDAAKHRHDARLAAQGAARSTGLWRPVFRPLPLPPF